MSNDLVRRFVSLLAGLGIFAVLLGHLRSVRGLGFLGWDTWPVLAACRSESLSDVFAAAMRPLGDGLVPGGFHRPLFHATVATESMLWGLDPVPYLRTNVLLFALSTLAVFFMVRRLAAAAPLAAPVAALFFALHPVAAQVIPFVPRRPELLLTIFCPLAIAWDHSSRHRPPGSKTSARSGFLLAVLAAALSKETSLALPALVGGARALFPVTPRPLREAAHGFAITTLLVALGLLPRFFVSDLIPQAPLRALEPIRVLKTGGRVLADVFAPPGPWGRPWIPALLLLAGGGALLLHLRREQKAKGQRKGQISPRSSLAFRLVGLGCVWIATFGLLFAIRGRVSPWYLTIVIAGAAPGVGILVAQGLETLRAAIPGASKVAAAAAVVGLGTLVLWWGATSPLGRKDLRFEAATQRGDRYLATLAARLDTTAGEKTVKFRGPPRSYEGIALLTTLSVEGWLRTTRPETPYRVRVDPEGGSSQRILVIPDQSR